MDASTEQLAVVTGSGGGIGAEVARQLGEAGHGVVVTSRQVRRAEEHAAVLRSEGIAAEAVQLDVTDERSVAGLAAAVGDRALRLLVNNAAAFADWQEVPSSADLATTAAVLDANVLGPWRVVQALLPALRRAQHAAVVNVGSGSGSHGDPQFGLAAGPSAASYAVSKAALHALSAKLAVELAGEGIRVDVAEPGLTATAPGMEEMGARPVVDGARSVTQVALLGPDAPTGRFLRDGQPLAW